MPEEVEVQQNNAENYVAELNNLRANSVDKTEYERILAENRTLASALATAPAATADDDAVQPKYTQEDIDKLSDKLYNRKNLTNLDFVNTMLTYRDAVMEVHGVDPFLPTKSNGEYVATEMELAKSQEIADGLRQMAGYAGNDARLFNNELKRCCK